MSLSKKPGWGEYAKRAFTYHWNLLVFGGAMVAALISGVPDIAIPLVLAGEMAYLGAMTGNRKFQKAIDAQVHKEKQEALEEAKPKKADKIDRILMSLDRNARNRFIELRKRCLEMQQIAAGVRGHDDDHGSALHQEALNKMLWVFLKLLAAQQGLHRFLITINGSALKQRVKDLETRLEHAQGAQVPNEKIIRSLVDSMATAKLRVANITTAQNNSEFVALELDRIEDKIKVLVEMSIAHEDPDFISSQVDSVAASVADTEAAMRGMDFIPEVSGLEEEEEDAPIILAASA